MPEATATKEKGARTCVGCGEQTGKASLIRIVRLADGSVAFDPTGRKPGRGAYVCRSEACLMQAIKKKQLERAFSAPLSDTVRDSLASQIAALPRPAEETADGE